VPKCYGVTGCSTAEPPLHLHSRELREPSLGVFCLQRSESEAGRVDRQKGYHRHPIDLERGESLSMDRENGIGELGASVVSFVGSRRYHAGCPVRRNTAKEGSSSGDEGVGPAAGIHWH
jgi:hypothetical protein